MQRELWRPNYGSFARMTCPTCRKGILRMDTKSFQKEEPWHVQNDLEARDLGHVLSAGRFKGFLRCDRPLCREIVVVAGSFQTQYHYEYDDETEEQITHEATDYRPYVMRPAPEIIEYPRKLNNASKEHLLRSFELFWVDYASCANRLRIVVEFLLDQFMVDRKSSKGGYLDLSVRIDKLAASHPDQKEFLDALRWLGNAGSHDGVVSLSDLLDCYEMLEHLLVELLEEKRSKMSAAAKRIIAAKGKASP